MSPPNRIATLKHTMLAVSDSNLVTSGCVSFRRGRIKHSRISFAVIRTTRHGDLLTATIFTVCGKAVGETKVKLAAKSCAKIQN